MVAYSDAGLRLSPTKCTSITDRIVFLGHELRHDGIRPAGNHVKAIKEWALPTTKSQARAFLGVAGYYRTHIKDYATIAKPWTDVIGKTDKAAERTPLSATDAMRRAFQVLKDRLVTFPVLLFPYFRGPMAGRFILDTDTQIAGILSQKQGVRRSSSLMGPGS